MSDNSNERYYRIGCNIYDRTKGAEWLCSAARAEKPYGINGARLATPRIS